MPFDKKKTAAPLEVKINRRPRVAIIGAGVAGLGAAWGLHRNCDITILEKNDYIGGHTNTVRIETRNGPIAVDTGFVVFNRKNYPNFAALLDFYNIPSHRTEMHFSVSARNRDLEYSSAGLFGLFADPRNLVRPRFYSMISDILRFYADAPRLALSENDISLGDYLARESYSAAFMDDHLLPMSAAIWSCSTRSILEFPARSLARFFINHGLTRLGAPSMWLTINGGSAAYIDPMTEAFRDRIRLASAVACVTRDKDRVNVTLQTGEPEQFDAVVFACHGPEANALLHDANDAERRIVSAFRRQPNRAVLHTDRTLMPKRLRVWSSWNYLSNGDDGQDYSVTYWMNALQRLRTETNYFVTLNPSSPPRDQTIIAEFEYQHPVFDANTYRAQRDIWSIQGQNRAWWCGAYLGYGFHEDGLRTGLLVAEAMTDWRRPWPLNRQVEEFAGPGETNARAGCN